MLHDTIAVANCILEIAATHDQFPTPMKLQKLVYFTHGWHLGLGQGALCDEEVEAWQWGPVFPSLYQAGKMWGSEPIRHLLAARRGMRTPRIKPKEDRFAPVLAARIWEVYGNMTASQLSRMTHQKGTPWREVRGNPQRGGIIPNDLIRAYFMAKASGDDPA